ncbi:uncharacterized protein LOC127122602 [Lathyrus oleraceus]|uniref:uncharacterized protein LOC127122602 n=1 Tax=Pisum sativum TaxID=3888 RepID=UPI0021CE944A|nr:uncharacterized protein LOC127122602 [Pisum sativum]
MAVDNNPAAMVERIMAPNGVNVGPHRPNYTSLLSEYILQSELPPRWKIPKFTKFYRDTDESIVEHVARYLIEAGEIANNENLMIKYFPSFLTKNAFTWFTTLPASPIHDWTRLERFHFLKAKCLTQVPEHELLEMAAGGLDYSIRKKLDTQYLRDMAQLTNRIRQVERLKAEKANPKTYRGPLNFDESEVDLAELKQGPPYSYKVLTPSNGKNPVELEKSDAFPKKTYTFDVTKCDDIFNLLVKDGQMIVPLGILCKRLSETEGSSLEIGRSLK